MPMTQEESDTWLVIQGESQERLDRINKAADARRARLEAEGRGPSTVWEPASSDDEEFGDIRPITPPASPPLILNGKSLALPILRYLRIKLLSSHHSRRHVHDEPVYQYRDGAA